MDQDRRATAAAAVAITLTAELEQSHVDERLMM